VEHQQLVEKILNKLIDVCALSARTSRDTSAANPSAHKTAAAMNAIRDFLLENADGLLAEATDANSPMRKAFLALTRLALSDVIALPK
jgi:hypothetical protein